MMRAFLSGLFILLFSTMALAITHPDEKLADPALEARAMQLTQGLRCVVCQNESIEASRADMARDLRILVRRQIMEGRTDAEIIRFLQDKYGDFILLKPPVTVRTYLLWAMPVLVLLVGGFMIRQSTTRRHNKTKRPLE